MKSPLHCPLCSFLTDSSFPDRFNDTEMGKEWDLPRGKLEHCPDLKVQAVSMSKSLCELFILILKGIFSAVLFLGGKASNRKKLHIDT